MAGMAEIHSSDNVCGVVLDVIEDVCGQRPSTEDMDRPLDEILDEYWEDEVFEALADDPRLSFDLGKYSSTYERSKPAMHPSVMCSLQNIAPFNTRAEKLLRAADARYPDQHSLSSLCASVREGRFVASGIPGERQYPSHSWLGVLFWKLAIVVCVLLSWPFVEYLRFCNPVCQACPESYSHNVALMLPMTGTVVAIYLVFAFVPGLAALAFWPQRLRNRGRVS